LTNLGSESETCVGSCVHLVGVSISIEKNFYRLPFTPPSLVRCIGPSRTNTVWDLEEIPKGAKLVGCKQVYKVKYDSEGNIEKYKGRLVAKSFTQREGIDYNETFSPASCKDSFRIIMALVAHYELELH
jgi:hypothetical protein